MTPKKRKPEQPNAQIVQGHVLDVLAGMEPESVSCVVTSPPYFSLRKYEAPDIVWGGNPKCRHRWSKERIYQDSPIRSGSEGIGFNDATTTKAQRWREAATCSLCGAWRGQFGLEPTPELYVEHTLDVLRAIRRVLRPDGVVWWNIGDGYASTGGHTAQGTNTQRAGRRYTGNEMPGISADGLKPKDLVLMPSRVALAAQADGWWIRQMVIWNKPNAMPESTKDRPTTTHEYVLMLTRSATYWYDQEAVREAPSAASMARISQPNFDQQTGGPKDYGKTGINPSRSARKAVENFAANPGRNMRSVWTFPTAQTPEAHFATFPEELPKRCILASTPQAICAKCGEARVRVMMTGEHRGRVEAALEDGVSRNDSETWHGRVGEGRERTTTGWTSCKCKAPSYVPGLVLDPFAGVGTTGKVATRLGRRFVGIELSEKYCAMAAKRMEQSTLGITL